MDIKVISFDYLDVMRIVQDDPDAPDVWRNWADWPDCSSGDRRDHDTPAGALATIPTALKITSCDTALITEAAAFLVAETLP